MNLASIQSNIEPDNYKNVLFVFDDVIDIKPSISPDEMISALSEEERKKFKNGMSVKDREALESYVIKTAIRGMGYVRDSILNLLNKGRENSISVIVVEHKLNSGELGCKIVAESTAIWLFPNSNNSKEKMVNFLTTKNSYDKQEAKMIVNLKYKQFDFLYINCDGAKFCMTPDQLILFKS